MHGTISTISMFLAVVYLLCSLGNDLGIISLLIYHLKSENTFFSFQELFYLFYF